MKTAFNLALLLWLLVGASSVVVVVIFAFKALASLL